MVERSRTGDEVRPAERKANQGLIAALALLALALLLSVVQLRPPAAKSKSVPLTEFSGGRAREVLRGLLGDGAPHPVGSPANARVRERILAHLRWLGYSPEVQESSACTSRGDCARVANVLARLVGREPGKSVLLMAHYDSVPAGPGVADNLAGVAAVLEIARVLKAGPPLRQGVLLLLDDGEEQGLLGARAFAQGSPAMDEVGAVVNLEARGTAGPSLMFETSGPDAWMVSRFAARASRPFTSSLLSTIYRLMPNDTDLSVFKQRDVPGLNFAFIGNPSQYHTAIDNFANLSPASLQHHGDNALAAVRGLADGDLSWTPQGQAVFFDLLRSMVVRWPAGLSPLLGALALVLTLAAAVLARRRGLATWGSVFLGLLATPAALLLTLAAAFGLQALLAGVFSAGWVARPLPAMAAFWLVSLAVTLWTAVLLTRRGDAAGLWAGVWIFWSLVGLILGLLLPGSSYLFLVPALVAGLAGLAAAGRPLAWLLPVVVAALLWFPVLLFLYAGLGLVGLLATAVLLAFVWATLTPLVAIAGPFGRRWLPLAAFAAAIVCAVLAMVSPPFSPFAPRRLSLHLHQDADSGAARWLARGTPPLPPALRKAADFAPRPVAPYPWSPPMARVFVAPAPRLNASGPDLTVLEESVSGGRRRLRLRLTSPRGAPVGMVLIPEGARLESIAIDGQSVPIADRQSGSQPARGWRPFTNHTLPSQGSFLDVVLGATEPMNWYVLDRSYGLPPSGRALLAARPKDAAPIQEGDATVVSRKAKI
jgi:peptidase M28-like protein